MLAQITALHSTTKQKRLLYQEIIIPSNPIDIIVFALIFFGLPIFLLIAAIPSLIVLDIMKEKRIRFVRKVAEKLGTRIM